MRGRIGKTTRPPMSQHSKLCCTLLASDGYTWHFCPCSSYLYGKIGSLRGYLDLHFAFTKYFSIFMVICVQNVDHTIPVWEWLYLKATSRESTKIILQQILEHLFNRVINLYQYSWWQCCIPPFSYIFLLLSGKFSNTLRLGLCSYLCSRGSQARCWLEMWEQHIF